MKPIIILAAMLALTLAAFAHPASAVSTKYTADSKTLSVNFDHAVKNHMSHYINTILVKLNDITIISQTSTSQENDTGGEYSYRIPNLKKGDKIEVITECNKTGKKSAKMVMN